MTSQDDGTDADLYSTDLPSLSADDESYVRELLASLPEVPIPDDLVARLDTALREAAATPVDAAGSADPADTDSDETADADGTADGDRTPATVGATVVPLDAARSRAGRRTRVLQVAAVSLLVVAGGATVVKMAGSDHSASTSTAAGAGTPPAAINTSFVSRSGHAYTDATLVSDVRSLAAHRTPAAASPPAAPQPNYGTESGRPSAASGGGSPTSGAEGGGTGDTATVGKGALTTQSALVACLAAVEDGLSEPVTPLAVDQGSYLGQSALVVVLPGTQDPKTTYDVFVVGILCGQNADAHLLKYVLVEAH